ncbi:Sentrin sumo-specific [Colletotrichum higginsianum IMI 349063]|uniref:Sentrin sumo-specific n=1 Tax=Colletotrichum higginsianum (strain IMI 349063) TaxID=759273 RepID=A0A1B7XQM8_COLHI|nr:Sentrin sumo-specific [Colletotrichum higginsianum IMI 349063]OBR02070.1 Sentrin sumo-specific [Colletotrichum higginsianum IMI 349063]
MPPITYDNSPRRLSGATIVRRDKLIARISTIWATEEADWLPPHLPLVEHTEIGFNALQEGPDGCLFASLPPPPHTGKQTLNKSMLETAMALLKEQLKLEQSPATSKFEEVSQELNQDKTPLQDNFKRHSADSDYSPRASLQRAGSPDSWDEEDDRTLLNPSSRTTQQSLAGAVARKPLGVRTLSPETPSTPISRLLNTPLVIPASTGTVVQAARQRPEADKAQAMMQLSDQDARLTTSTIELLLKALTLPTEFHIMDPSWVKLDSGLPESVVIIPERLVNKKVIMMPIHHASEHWTLAVWHREENCIHHYDSVESQSRSDTLSKWAKRWPLPPTAEAKYCPQQSDGVSCGIFVVVVARALLNGHGIPTRIEPAKERAELLNMLRNAGSSNLSNEAFDKKDQLAKENPQRDSALGAAPPLAAAHPDQTSVASATRPDKALLTTPEMISLLARQEISREAETGATSPWASWRGEILETIHELAQELRVNEDSRQEMERIQAQKQKASEALAADTEMMGNVKTRLTEFMAAVDSNEDHDINPAVSLEDFSGDMVEQLKTIKKRKASSSTELKELDSKRRRVDEICERRRDAVVLMRQRLLSSRRGQ